MVTKVKRAVKRQNGYMLFNARGGIIELTEYEYEIYKRYCDLEKYPEELSLVGNENECLRTEKKAKESKRKNERNETEEICYKYREAKKLIEQLCYYEFIVYDGYTPKKVPVKFSKKLLKANSSEPVFPAPLIAHLGITSKCNMGCEYCSIRKTYKCMNDLTTEQWKKVISDLVEMGVFQVGFTGGEPTLRKDLVELCEYVESKGCTFNLTTNCWHFPEDLIIKLKKAGMQQCQVSIDCHIPKVNDKYRRNGSLQKVVDTIRLLQKHDIIVGIDTVVSKSNIELIPEFIEWLEELKVPYLTLIKIKKGDLNLELFKQLLPEYDEYSALLEELSERKNEMPCVTIDCGSVANIHNFIEDDEVDSIPVAGCPLGHTLLSISPNGDVYPCVALSDKEFCAGNVIKDGVEKIWNDSPVLKELRQLKSKVKGRCRGCDRFDYCRGGCRGIANCLSGNLWESDMTCKRVIKDN